MKLISLELKNFRQHLDSRMDFTDGLTGIIGKNGAGKSTILEGISWALYGAPAVRGTNDTLRSTAAEGGAKASVTLAFELGGTIYNVTRTLDASGRSGSAVLEIDGKALRSGMSEVTAAVGKLLGMDYQAFFTSFFTGQKQLEFMSQLEGRARAVAISRMLGYDRLTKARDQANEDRKGLHREIEGLERGLPDPEELKERKKEAGAVLAAAAKALEEAEKAYKSAQASVDKLKPIKETQDQKARRYEEITRRLELDKMDVERNGSRLEQLKAELIDLENKGKELESLRPELQRFEQAKVEYKELAELQKYESERQRIAGQISALDEDIKRLQAREKQLETTKDAQLRAETALAQAERLLAETDKKIQAMREQRLAQMHAADARAKQLVQHLEQVEIKRAQIANAGASGKCPTCERPLTDELPKVIASFNEQIAEIQQQIQAATFEKQALEADSFESNALNANRQTMVLHIDKLKREKAQADALVGEYNSVKQELQSRKTQHEKLQSELSALPTGFNQEKFEELRRVGEDLRPVRERAVALKSALDRGPAVSKEVGELTDIVSARSAEIASAEKSLAELEFSKDDYEKLVREFEAVSSALNDAVIAFERQKGETNTAGAILKQIEREEEAYKSKLEELKEKRAERLHLQALAEAFDKLRSELNDRIRPELEAIASELLAMMTDGRYSVLEVNENYQAMIRDDGELKPVISGGEDDVVNLALRLAISQMIAERAGQSFSLLVLDEVFGSLDDTRRDNVVALLQNLKNRFEQIILITHVESIHDEVDNCVWVELDERTKTSRLTDRSNKLEELAAGNLMS